MRLPLAAVLLLCAVPALAAPEETPQQRRVRLAAEAAAGSDCVDFDAVGCRYLPPSAGADPPHAGGCAVDRLAGGQHNPGVSRCLPSYLRDRPCRP